MVQVYQRMKNAGVKQEMGFPKAEYDARVAKVRKAMREQGLDALVVHHTPNFCYLFGYQSPLANWYGCAILPLEGQPIAQLIDVEIANLLVHGWDNEDIYSLDWMWQSKAPAQLAEILEKRGFANKKIGLELGLPGCNGLTHQVLREKLPKAKIVDASDLVLYIRAVKSPAELAHIKEAARMTDIGMEAALGAIGDGKKDNDIMAAATGAMFKAGSEFLSIQPLVYVGPWTTLTHVTAKRRTMRKGDTATIELTSAYYRYAAPLYRTGIVGKPSDDVKRLAHYVLARLSLLYENAKPGRVASDVARAVAEGAKGLEPEGSVGRGVAYSIGIGFPPDWVDHATFITEKHDRVLEPGMAFHTPAGCILLNRAGVAFSETMVITGKGCETLSKLPRELQVF